jgi:hypothetical protein
VHHAFIWVPNIEEIHGTSGAIKSDESTPGVSAQFSCDFCDKTFSSREELKQHSIQEYSKDD